MVEPAKTRFQDRESQPRTNFISGQVDVVIVNWNGKRYLGPCLRSVLDQTYPNIDLTIIDNDSRDDSVEWLRAEYPGIKVLPQAENLGFSRAHNLAIHRSRGEYYMPLNFDVLLKPAFVEKLVDRMKTDPNVGSVTGRLQQMDESGKPTGKLDSTGHVIRKSRTVENRGEGEKDIGQYNDPDEVFGVSGTAPLYRREMLESIRIGDEYYDESYFAYWEDVDLDWRAQHSNWKALYTPDAVAYHVRRGGRRPDDLAVRLTFRNRYLTIVKNDRLRDLLRDVFHLVPREAFCWLQMTIDPHYRHLWSMLVPTLKALPSALKKRKHLRWPGPRGNRPDPRRHFHRALTAREVINRIRRCERHKPITVITGTGRCGTSFTAQVFREAGIDPGGGYDPNVRAGWEYAPVVAINEELLKSERFPDFADSERLLPDFLRRLQTAVEDKRLVKDPRFSFLLELWVHAGLVERVILLVRRLEEAAASGAEMSEESCDVVDAQRRSDYVLDVCGRHGIPCKIIHFPEVVREEGDDFRRLLRELKRLGVSRRRAVAAIRNVRDPNMVHHSPEPDQVDR